MSILKKIWRECLLLLSVVSFVCLMYTFAVNRPTDSTAQSVMILGIIGSALLAVLMLRSLWRAKWKKAATESFQRIFVKLQDFFDKFLQKTGFFKKSKTVLMGKTTIIFDKAVDGESREPQRQKKPPKWKQLSDDRGRMRYLYRQMVSGKIKKGALICASDTPLCVKKNQSKTEREEALFDLYIACRYDERKIPNGVEIKALKEDLEIK